MFFLSIVYVCVGACACHRLHLETRGQLVEMFSFHHEGLRDGTQVVMLNCKPPDMLSHFSSSQNVKNLEIGFIFICVYARLHVSMRECLIDTCGGQQTVPDPLELSYR